MKLFNIIRESSVGKLEVAINSERGEKLIKISGTPEQCITKMSRAMKKANTEDFRVEDFHGFDIEDDKRLSTMLDDFEVQ